MPNLDPTFEALKQDPQASKLLENPAMLNTLLSSPETQQLITLLKQAGGDKLQGAARSAAKGNPDALLGLLNHVMDSPDGTRVVEAFNKKAQS